MTQSHHKVLLVAVLELLIELPHRHANVDETQTRSAQKNLKPEHLKVHDNHETLSADEDSDYDESSRTAFKGPCREIVLSNTKLLSRHFV